MSQNGKADDLQERCRAAGLPVTLQRRAVLEALSERADHPTAEDVAADVAKRHNGVARATVYRALEAFVEHGVAIKVCHPDATARYDAKTHRHHHLICDRCGSMRDLDEPDFDSLPLPENAAIGFQVRDYSVHFRGVCASCRKDEEKQS